MHETDMGEANGASGPSARIAAASQGRTGVAAGLDAGLLRNAKTGDGIGHGGQHGSRHGVKQRHGHGHVHGLSSGLHGHGQINSESRQDRRGSDDEVEAALTELSHSESHDSSDYLAPSPDYLASSSGSCGLPGMQGSGGRPSAKQGSYHSTSGPRTQSAGSMGATAVALTR